MNKKLLGWTDLELSRVGLGTWAIGGGGWQHSLGPQDDRESIDAVNFALENGVNWIDTAPVYGLNGHAETIIGKAISEREHVPIIATKYGSVMHEDGRVSSSLKRDSIVKQVESSLKRLGIEAIDLYQMHWPQPEEELEEGWATVASLVEQGKVRYAGASNFNIEQLNKAQRIHPIASLQPPYNMLQRGIEEEILPFCKKNNIGVIVYSPMAKGILTDKFSREYLEGLSRDDFRRTLGGFQEPELSINLDLVEGLSALSKNHGFSLAQLALAWVLRRDEITAAIVGTRRSTQLEETVKSVDLVLTEETLDGIHDLLARREAKLESV